MSKTTDDLRDAAVLWKNLEIELEQMLKQRIELRGQIESKRTQANSKREELIKIKEEIFENRDVGILVDDNEIVFIDSMQIKRIDKA